MDNEKQYRMYGAAISFCQTIQDDENIETNDTNRKTVIIFFKKERKLRECSYCKVLAKHATW